MFLDITYQNGKKYTKMTTYIPNGNKIYEMAVNRPNGHTIYQHLSLQDTPTFAQTVIFGFKMYHLATPAERLIQKITKEGRWRKRARDVTRDVTRHVAASFRAQNNACAYVSRKA
jgi:hypothetical protein